MTGALVSLLTKLGLSNYWGVFLVALIPTIEVKGAIPVGAALDLDIWLTCLVAFASSLIICPLILLLFKPILNWLKKFKWCKGLADAIEGVFREKAEKATQNGENAENKVRWYKTVVLFLFVALPLPLTGVWTGSGAAVFMDQKYRHSIPPIVAGCAVQSLLFTGLILLFGQGNMKVIDIILWVLTGFIFISLGFFIYKIIKHSKKNKSAEQSEVKTTEVELDETNRGE